MKPIKIEDLLDRQQITLNLEKISKELRNKKILITGASGSIGSEIVKQILHFKPKEMLLIDRAESPLFELQEEIQSLNITSGTKVNYFLCDTTDQFRLSEIFSEIKPELVFHASAYKHVTLMEENPYEAIKNNILSTKLLADLAIKHDVEKFILISTDKTANPTNVMGASKRICELYVQTYSKDENIRTKFITTRFGNVLGSTGSVIPLFKKQIERGGPVTLTHKEMIRYLMTIPEACQLVLEASAMGNGGEIYLFNMGEPVRIYDLAIKMIHLSGLIPYKDIQIKEIGLRPGEKLYEELLNNKENTMPTHHERILIGKDSTKIDKNIKEEIENLLKHLTFENQNQLVARMKSIVPEYVSNNSGFSVLDKAAN